MSIVLSPASKQITKAKMAVRGWMPYLSALLSSMRTFVGTDVSTMAVDDQGRLYINEHWVQTLTANQVAYVLLHEVLHVVLSHGRRRKATLPDATPEQCHVWNIAADLCIQQMLARHHEQYEPATGVKIGGSYNGTPFLDIPGLVRGMTTEAYYAILWDFTSKRPKGGKPGDQPSPSGESDSSSGQGSGDQGESGADDSGSTGSSGAETLDPQQSGSSSDGVKRAWEKPGKPTDRAVMEGKLREVLQRAEQQEASRPGSVPGQLRQSLQVRLNPQPDPFDQLRSIVARSVANPIGADEYTYRRLCRRQPDDMARLRGVVRLSPECSIILDTSGSMCGSSIQARAMTAIAQGLRKVRRPRVVQFDTRVTDARNLSSMKDFLWCGGGGTDMATAVEQEDRDQRPDAIVLITDGETGWPESRTRARLVVALCKKSHCEADIPAWAKVVRCYQEAPSYAG